MAKRRQPPSTDPARPACPSRVVGHRAKIWLATVSTVVGVATGMFSLRDQVFPSEAGSAGAMSTSAYEEHVGRICDEVNANDRLRAHEDSKLRSGLVGAKTTLTQRNALLDPVRRTMARDGHALAAFSGLEPPKALAPVRRDTQLAWNRNLARVRDYAVRLDRAGTRPELLAAVDHLSTLRPLLAADGVRLASGLQRLGGAECDLRAPTVTRVITLPYGHEPVNTAAAPSPNQRKNGANTPRRRSGRPGAHVVRRGAANLGRGRKPQTGSARRGKFRVNTPGSQAAVRG